MAAALTTSGAKKIASLLQDASSKMIFDWHTETAFFTVSRASDSKK